MTRMVILHYHLFKNAGTSLDRILKQNFGDAWVTREFEMKGGNTAEVERWIASTPDAIAFSSHTMIGPLPRVEGVEVVPIVLLRDPVDRIRSAYKFERKQQADTWGAQLAKTHDFESYIRARLAVKGDRQCVNFQTSRIASLIQSNESELNRAIYGVHLLKKHGIVGSVEAFDSAIKSLSVKIQSSYPKFKWAPVRENISVNNDSSELNPTIIKLIEANNEDDAKIFEIIKSTRSNALKKDK